MSDTYTIHIDGTSYNLNTKGHFTVRAQGAETGRRFHIVRIQDKCGRELVNRRIYATDVRADKLASNWLNELLVTNPDIFLGYTIEAVRY
jgi:hypothetical protein